MRVNTYSVKETSELGQRLGQLLRAGDVVAIDGGLGSGKTVLVKGMAIGLGIAEEVTSPTFTIVNEYYGRIPLYHFDVYRLENPQQLYDIGYEEYFFDQGVTVIEWAQLIRDLLPKQYLQISINVGANENQRIIDIEPHGDRYTDVLERLKML